MIQNENSMRYLPVLTVQYNGQVKREGGDNFVTGGLRLQPFTLVLETR